MMFVEHTDILTNDSQRQFSLDQVSADYSMMNYAILGTLGGELAGLHFSHQVNFNLFTAPFSSIKPRGLGLT